MDAVAAQRRLAEASDRQPHARCGDARADARVRRARVTRVPRPCPPGSEGDAAAVDAVDRSPRVAPRQHIAASAASPCRPCAPSAGSAAEQRHHGSLGAGAVPAPVVDPDDGAFAKSVDNRLGRVVSAIETSQTVATAAARDDREDRTRAPRRRPRTDAWRLVELDDGPPSVRCPQGTMLDLGATAKALAADRAARAAAAAAGAGVLVALGGDVAVRGPAPAAGWRVHVTDDHRSAPDAPGQTALVGCGGLATSSTSVRNWSLGE
jgi:ApbE family